MTTTQLPIRPAAVAGRFYPASPERLRREVQELLEQAQAAELPPVRALIVPHAGYRYSGPVAASAFRQLATAGVASTTVVYLLGPAHYAGAGCVALAPYAGFATPLGIVPQRLAAAESLARLSDRFTWQASAHQPEHCLEVELPFLQVALGDFELVAMLCGQPAHFRAADGLAPHLGPGSLLVVSSDLSHYHAYDEARRLDNAFLDAVIEGDVVRAARGEACGLGGILMLMHLAHHMNWRAHLLDYRNSGDTSGDRRRVVGYAALAYTDR